MRIFHDEGRWLNIWWPVQTASSKKFIPLTQTHKVQESPTLELHDSGINTQWHLSRWSPCCGGQERPRFRAEGLRGLGGGFYKTVWLQATQRCILKSKETSFWGKDMISSDWKTFHFYRTRDHMISSQGRQLLGALRWRGQGTEPSLAIWAPPLPHGLPDETPG
jgi:hypothetical protein